MGSEADDAARSLKLLDTHFHRHPENGPTERRAPGSAASTPLNLAMVDHIGACINEVVDHAREITAGPLKPLPERAAAVYAWYLEQTADAGPEQVLRRDIVIYRQHLEHAIALGEHKVVRAHPCPACETWGLMWQPTTRRALCPNRYCRDRNGMARTWSLARLATAHVTAQENRARSAT